MSFMGMYMLISLLLRKYIYDMSFFRGFGLRPCSFGRTCSRRRSTGSFVFKFPAAVALRLAGRSDCRGARVAHGGLSGALIYQQYAISLDPKVIAGRTLWAIAYGFLILSSSIFFSFVLPCRCLAESRLQGNGSGCWQFQKTWRRQVGVRVRSQTASYLLAAHWCLLCLVIWVCNKQI